MGWIREYLLYAFLIAVVYATVTLVPRFASTVQVPPDWSDIEGLDNFATKGIDSRLPFSELRRDDPVCFRLGEQEDRATNFGWIAALPGDLVLIEQGKLLVNGQANNRGMTMHAPRMGPLRVPADHVFLVSSFHQHDSTVNGPLPASAIRGRLKALP